MRSLWQNLLNLAPFMHIELQQPLLVRSQLVAIHVLQNVQLALPNRGSLPRKVVPADQRLLIDPPHCKFHLFHNIVFFGLFTNSRAGIEVKSSALHIELLNTYDIALHRASLLRGDASKDKNLVGVDLHGGLAGMK